MITYSSLVADTPTQIMGRNDDLPAAMPKIIWRAQEMMVNAIDHDEFREGITSQLTAGTGDFDVTLGLDGGSGAREVLELRGMRIDYDGSQYPLLIRDAEMLAALYPDTSLRAAPRYYALGERIELYAIRPIPDIDCTITVTANLRPDYISDTLETNIFTRRSPLSLEAAVHAQACLFNKDYAGYETYEAEMARYLAQENMQVARRRRDMAQERPREIVNVRGE